MILRPYQSAAVKAALSHPGNCLLALPTGTGKTVIIAELCGITRGNVLVLAHRSELLDQAESKIGNHINEPIGRIQAGSDIRHRVTVASVQSAINRQLPKPSLLIIDEAHHATAPTYRALIDAAGCKVIGLTATPYRADESEDDVWKLASIFGEAPAYVYPLMDAVRDGWLVPIRQWGVSTTSSLDDVGMSHGDLAASGLLTLDNPERNALVADSYRRLCEGRQAIVFACGVQHAQNLAATFIAMGTESRAIWGDDPNRDETIRAYRSGAIRAIVNCNILTEGFDDPNTSALLMARPTASRGLYTQMAGRGLRPEKGKVDCIIIDFLDSGKRHQLSLQSAIKLSGIPGEIPLEKQNARGRKVTEVSEQITQEYLERVADIKKQLELMPLKWAAKDITPRWSAERLSLVGYSPTSRWELKPATTKQVKTIRGFRFQPQRDLTRGEASALINRLLTLEAEEPEMATEKQAKYLAWKGLARYAEAKRMTKREAKRLIARGK